MRIPALAALAAALVAPAPPPQGDPDVLTVRVPIERGTLVVEYRSETLYDPERSLLLARPWFLDIDASGRIVVGDTGDHALVGLTPRGEHRFTAGSRGQGPGEMQDVWNVAITPAGRAVVLDRFAHRLHVFEADGTFREALPLPVSGLVDPSSLIALDERTLVLAATNEQGPLARHPLHVLQLSLPPDERGALTLVHSFGRLEPTDHTVPDFHRMYLGGPVSEDLDGQLLYVQKSPFALFKYTVAGELLWAIEQPDAWPHWREFERTLPDGRRWPGAFTRSLGLWPIGQGVYLHQIDEVTPEYAAWQQTQTDDGPRCECESSRRVAEVLWIDRGRLVQSVRLPADSPAWFLARDAQGHLYGYEDDRLVRVRVALRIE